MNNKLIYCLIILLILLIIYYRINQKYYLEGFDEEEESSEKCCQDLRLIGAKSFTYTSTDFDPPVPKYYVKNSNVTTKIITDDNNVTNITITLLKQNYKSFSIYSKNHETYINVSPKILSSTINNYSTTVSQLIVCKDLCNIQCSVKKGGKFIINLPSWKMTIIAKQ